MQTRARSDSSQAKIRNVDVADPLFPLGKFFSGVSGKRITPARCAQLMTTADLREARQKSASCKVAITRNPCIRLYKKSLWIASIDRIAGRRQRRPRNHRQRKSIPLRAAIQRILDAGEKFRRWRLRSLVDSILIVHRSIRSRRNDPRHLAPTASCGKQHPEFSSCTFCQAAHVPANEITFAAFAGTFAN